MGRPTLPDRGGRDDRGQERTGLEQLLVEGVHRLDHLEGPLIGTLTTQATGETYNHQRMQYVPVQRVTGVHDVYIVFRGTWGTSVADWVSFLP